MNHDIEVLTTILSTSSMGAASAIWWGVRRMVARLDRVEREMQELRIKLAAEHPTTQALEKMAERMDEHFRRVYERLDSHSGVCGRACLAADLRNQQLR